MYIFTKIADLQQFLSSQLGSIGFVPTMGALHIGHLSLIEKSKSETNLTVCSIFVNPTQFNDKKDFDKYPNTIEADIEKLASVDTDVLFLPSVDEMYPNGTEKIKQYEIGYLDTVLDGKFRPGHFNGVCVVVHKLLDAVKPTHLFMGEKDFQQCLVVKRLLEIIKSDIQLITCPTRREPNGLAMSSRNERLSKGGREKASAIHYVLKSIKSEQTKSNFADLESRFVQYLDSNSFETEYILLSDANTLELLSDFDPAKKMVVLIASKLEGVRLIDNLRIN
ncbi:MAG TPA: pantoate--beta-alanine ligase [Chitinophagaceae bacterium]|nr:pantoate--beta-alanine ligase [Chitinophagaceae bacterium]